MASTSELQQRHEKLREVMQSAGYSIVVVAGNTEFNQRGYIRYLTDWRLFGGTGYLVFALEHKPIFVLGLGAQAEWAQELIGVADTKAVYDKIDGVVETVQEMADVPDKIGIIGLNNIMPYGDAQRLMAAFPNAQIDDATGLLESFWGILSSEGLAEVETAHQQVAQVFDAFRGALQPGRPERSVVADAYQVAVGLGCFEGMIHLNHDDKSGTRPATDRIIGANDTIKMFMEFLTPSGYLIELGGCFSFQPPPADRQRKFDIVARAIREGIAATRPGMQAAELVDIIRQPYEAEGWEITGRRLWDFHGQGMHSLLRPFGMPGSEDMIYENMMINIHPGILTTDGFGISATNNYIVTKQGGRALGDFQHEWHVI